MKTASSFFKHDVDENLGVFYPTGYLVALFPSLDLADEARKILEGNSYNQEDILILPGNEFVHMVEELHKDASTWSKFTSKVSEIVGTESLHLENDVKAAQQGAGFLAVACLDQDAGQKIFGLLKPAGPIAMRRYSSMTIDRMV